MQSALVSHAFLPSTDSEQAPHSTCARARAMNRPHDRRRPMIAAPSVRVEREDVDLMIATGGSGEKIARLGDERDASAVGRDVGTLAVTVGLLAVRRQRDAPEALAHGIVEQNVARSIGI